MLIAIDGGASQCRLAVFDENGDRVVESRLARPASLSSGVSQTAATVREGIRILQDELGESLNSVKLSCGLAGSLRKALRTAFVDEFRGERKVLVVTDGHAQLLGATGGQPGACLAVGTGSVMHWQDKQGVFGMAGGWGYPVGDEASGAWLGMRLLGGYVRALDQGDALTPLWLDVQDRVGASTEAIQSWTTCSQSSKVGSLAVLASQHAEQGDAFCLALIDSGVVECERLIACAPVNVPRWIHGGLSEVYQSVLETRGHVFASSEGDALDGLYLHAKAQGAQ